MPKILGMDEKNQALKDITDGLKEVVDINKFLNTANPTGEFTITFKDAEGKKIRTDIVCESKEEMDILLLGCKERMKTKIHQLAEKYQIGLDEEEEKILNL